MGGQKASRGDALSLSVGKAADDSNGDGTACRLVLVDRGLARLVTLCDPPAVPGGAGATSAASQRSSREAEEGEGSIGAEGGQSASRGDALSLSKIKCCMRLIVRGKLKEALHVALVIEGDSSMQ